MERKLNLQPISMLPTLSHIIVGMTNNTENNYNFIIQAKSKPHVLDDYTVNRMIKLYKVQLEDIELYKKQLEKWETEPINEEQKEEIDNLHKYLNKAEKLSTEILKTSDYLKENTIEKVINKPDGELALEWLTKNNDDEDI